MMKTTPVIKRDYTFEEKYPAYCSLLHTFDALYPLSQKLVEAIIAQAEILDVKKKTILLNAGETCNYIYFIVKGAARVYHLDRDMEETTSWFLFEGELLISVFSFFTGQPSFEYLQTLEDCRFIVLSKDKLDLLYREFLELNFIGRKLTEYYYIRNEIQANELRMLSAKERYDKLMSVSPALINRVPLNCIASYLGISPETLSRIRKQI